MAPIATLIPLTVTVPLMMNTAKSQILTNQNLFFNRAGDQLRSTNPTTAYYLSKNLFELNVWDDQSDQENATNLQVFTTLKDNLNKTNDPNLDQLKEPLLKIIDQVFGYKSYRNAKKEFEKFASSPDATVSWDEVKEVIKANYGNPPENWDEFESLKNINNALLTISGINQTNIDQIETLSSQQLKTQDLITSNTSNPAEQTSSIHEVAGTDYTSLIKIATIDPEEAGIYQLNFELNNTAYQLNIDNRNQQLSQDWTNATDQLTFFGRINNYQQLSTAKEIGNFVLTKSQLPDQPEGREKTVVNLAVRLKNGETLTKIHFSQPSETNQFKNPFQFGVLDVQLTKTSTFVSYINSQGNNAQKPTTLIEAQTNNQDAKTQVAKPIQFFNNQLIINPPTNQDWQNQPTNQSINWYAKANQALDLKLNLINQKPDQPQFKPIYDSQSGRPLSLNLVYDGKTNPTFSPIQTILLNENRFNQLPELIKNKWEEFSAFQLLSTVDATKQVANQTLKFNDHWWFLDFSDQNPTFSPDLTQARTLSLPDPTQAIFFEKPRDYQANQPTTSSLKPTTTPLQNAKAWAIVSQLINQYRNPESKLAKMALTSELIVPIWDQSTINNLAQATNSNQAFKNLENVPHETMFDLWTYLTSFTTQAHVFLKQIFGATFANQLDPSRYKNPDITSIISNYFDLANPYLINFSPTQDRLNQIMQLIEKIDPNQPSDQQLMALNHQVQLLITYQIEAVINEFQSLAFSPLVNQLVHLTNDQTKIKRTTISPELIKFITTNDLSIATLNANIKVQQQDITLNQQMLNIIKVLRHPNLDLAMALLAPSQRHNWSAFNEQTLTTFNQNDHQAINFQKTLLWVNLLFYFGYDLITPYVSQATINLNQSPTIIDLNNNQALDFAQAIEAIVNQFSNQPNLIKTLIAGANVYQILNQKLNKINNGYQSPITNISNQKLLAAINSVFNNVIGSKPQLEKWNLIISGEANKYQQFVNNLSTNNPQLPRLVKAINDDQNIIKLLDLVAPDWKREAANPQLIGIISGTVLAAITLLSIITYLTYHFRKENFQKYQKLPTLPTNEA